MTPDEIREKCPIMDVTGVIGGLWADREGYLDTTGTVHAYAGAARKRGATVIEHNKVEALNQRADGTWEVVTEKGVIHAEHVINAGGLWAKQVGRMVGARPAALAAPASLLRDRDHPRGRGARLRGADDGGSGGIHLHPAGPAGGCWSGSTRVDHKHWNIDGAPWDYGFDLIPEEIDRIAGELEMAWRRYPVLERVGVETVGQRRLHLLPGRQSPGRTGAGDAQLLARLRGDGRVPPGRRGRQVARGVDDPRRGGGRRVADGHRALRAVHLEPRVHPPDHRAVLLAPLRHDLPQRAAPPPGGRYARPPPTTR